MKKSTFTVFYSKILSLLVLAHFGHHLLVALLVPLLPYIRDDFILDYSQAGWLVSAFTLAYGISQLPAGWLADRIGPRLMITIGISGVALAGLLVSISPTYVVMLFFLVLLGAMGGGYHPAATPLVSASVVPEGRGRALGIHQIGGSASYFLSPLIAIALANAFGWRGSFIGLAIPVFAFGIILYIFLSRHIYDKKSGTEAIVNELGIFTSGKWRRLIVFLILAIVSEAVIWAVIAFIPLFLVDQLNIEEGAAGALLAVVYSGGLWAAPVGGYLCDRLGKVPMIIATSLFASLIIYLLTLISYGWSMSAVLVAVGMSAFFLIPVSETYLINHSPERKRSMILGIYYVGSIGGPGALAPAIGYLIDWISFDTSFAIVGAALATITLACSVFLWGDRD